MAEYVERGKVLSGEEFFGEFATWDNPMSDGCLAVRSEFIINLPAADVAPVRHGVWVWVKDHWECSVCRGPRFHDLALGVDASYCGRCGAKMDREG